MAQEELGSEEWFRIVGYRYQSKAGLGCSWRNACLRCSEALGWKGRVPAPHLIDVVGYLWNASTLEVGAGGSVQSHSWQPSEFKANRDYMKAYLKIKN